VRAVPDARAADRIRFPISDIPFPISIGNRQSAFGIPRAALLAATVLACGCVPTCIVPEPPRVNAFRSHVLARMVRPRVLVLPFRYLDQEAAQAITEAFILELEKTQAVEVVSPYTEAGKALEGIQVWDNGGLDVRALTTLRRSHRVDALAIGQVTQYRPFDPPVLGLRVQVVATRTGAVLWGAEGCFDARESGVRALMQRFHDCRLETGERSFGWEVLLSSPRHYAQFVAHQLVATLEAPRPSVVAAARPK